MFVAIFGAAGLLDRLFHRDQNLVAGIAQRVYVMRKGRFVSELAAGDLADPAIVKEQLGI